MPPIKQTKLSKLTSQLKCDSGQSLSLVGMSSTTEDYHISFHIDFEASCELIVDEFISLSSMNAIELSDQLKSKFTQMIFDEVEIIEDETNSNNENAFTIEDRIHQLSLITS